MPTAKEKKAELQQKIAEGKEAEKAQQTNKRAPFSSVLNPAASPADTEVAQKQAVADGKQAEIQKKEQEKKELEKVTKPASAAYSAYSAYEGLAKLPDALEKMGKGAAAVSDKADKIKTAAEKVQKGAQKVQDWSKELGSNEEPSSSSATPKSPNAPTSTPEGTTAPTGNGTPPTAAPPGPKVPGAQPIQPAIGPEPSGAPAAAPGTPQIPGVPDAKTALPAEKMGSDSAGFTNKMGNVAGKVGNTAGKVGDTAGKVGEASGSVTKMLPVLGTAVGSLQDTKKDVDAIKKEHAKRNAARAEAKAKRAEEAAAQDGQIKNATNKLGDGIDDSAQKIDNAFEKAEIGKAVAENVGAGVATEVEIAALDAAFGAGEVIRAIPGASNLLRKANKVIIGALITMAVGIPLTMCTLFLVSGLGFIGLAHNIIENVVNIPVVGDLAQAVSERIAADPGYRQLAMARVEMLVAENRLSPEYTSLIETAQAADGTALDENLRIATALTESYLGISSAYAGTSDARDFAQDYLDGQTLEPDILVFTSAASWMNKIKEWPIIGSAIRAFLVSAEYQQYLDDSQQKEMARLFGIIEVAMAESTPDLNGAYSQASGSTLAGTQKNLNQYIVQKGDVTISENQTLLDALKKLNDMVADIPLAPQALKDQISNFYNLSVGVEVVNALSASERGVAPMETQEAMYEAIKNTEFVASGDLSWLGQVFAETTKGEYADVFVFGASNMGQQMIAKYREDAKTLKWQTDFVIGDLPETCKEIRDQNRMDLYNKAHCEGLSFVGLIEEASASMQDPSICEGMTADGCSYIDVPPTIGGIIKEVSYKTQIDCGLLLAAVTIENGSPIEEISAVDDWTYPNTAESSSCQIGVCGEYGYGQITHCADQDLKTNLTYSRPLYGEINKGELLDESENDLRNGGPGREPVPGNGSESARCWAVGTPGTDPEYEGNVWGSTCQSNGSPERPFSSGPYEIWNGLVPEIKSSLGLAEDPHPCDPKANITASALVIKGKIAEAVACEADESCTACKITEPIDTDEEIECVYTRYNGADTASAAFRDYYKQYRTANNAQPSETSCFSGGGSIVVVDVNSMANWHPESDYDGCSGTCVEIARPDEPSMCHDYFSGVPADCRYGAWEHGTDLGGTGWCGAYAIRVQTLIYGENMRTSSHFSEITSPGCIEAGDLVWWTGHLNVALSCTACGPNQSCEFTDGNWANKVSAKSTVFTQAPRKVGEDAYQSIKVAYRRTN